MENFEWGFEWEDKIDDEDYVSADDVNSLAYGITETQRVIENLPKRLMPDWSQNDESAPDYVKNRTHYDGTRGKIIAPQFYSKTVGVDMSTDPRRYYDYHTYTVSNQNYDIFDVFSDGRNLEIEFDGNKYTGTVEKSKIILYSLDDWAKLEVQLTTNTNPNGTIRVLHRYYTSGDKIAEGATLSITPILNGEVKQLDTKYIPDYVSRTYVDSQTELMVEKFNAFKKEVDVSIQNAIGDVLGGAS